MYNDYINREKETKVTKFNAFDRKNLNEQAEYAAYENCMEI
jgi:hypothetical protein